MMNTRKLSEKTLKAVKDVAIFTRSQEKACKAIEQVEALRCSGTVASKHCGRSENKNTTATVFPSNNYLYQQKNDWNTYFSLPLNVNKNHITCSPSPVVFPVSSESCCGVATSTLGSKYVKNFMTQQNRMMSTRAVNANKGTIEGIITTLNDKFNADIVNDTQAIYQFNILSGDRREIYYIDLRNGSGSAGKGKSEGNPDTIFSIDAENFNRLVEGNLRAPTAYMSGRMKISGSMQKAAKLEKLFATLLYHQ